MAERDLGRRAWGRMSRGHTHLTQHQGPGGPRGQLHCGCRELDPTGREQWGVSLTAKARRPDARGPQRKAQTGRRKGTLHRPALAASHSLRRPSGLQQRVQGDPDQWPQASRSRKPRALQAVTGHGSHYSRTKFRLG